MDGIKQLIGFIKQYRAQVFLAGVLGACTILCSVGLLGASAVLISKAAIVPYSAFWSSTDSDDAFLRFSAYRA